LAQHNFENRLLRLMAEDDLASLGEPVPVSLELRQPLDEAGGEAMPYVYFFESGIASVVADRAGKMGVELGIVGHEGMIGLGVTYGELHGTFNSFMQVEGRAYRFDAGQVMAAIEERPQLRRLLLRYAASFSIQVATTAIANGQSRLEERLCRWLLMVSDRVGAHFHITHEFISMMLAVRRSGVTLAVQILEGKGLIRAGRATIEIIDRKGLIEGANGAYGLAEREYARLVENLE
jgi:CRP-like cAMP-binding protein